MQTANNKLDIDHYVRMAKDNHRGLVPMVFAKNVLPFAAGQVAGFRPEEAKALHDDGTAVPHESVYDGGALETKTGASVLLNQTEDERRRSAVELGDDPLGLHQLERIKLAKSISGGDVGTAEAADEVIKTEIARRELITPTPDQRATNIAAAALNPAAGAPSVAVTSQSAKGSK